MGFGFIGRPESIVNLLLDLRPSPDLRVEAGSGKSALDSVVRNDSGRRNGTEKGGSPSGFWNRPSDELCCIFEGTRGGCDCKYRYRFR